MSLHSKAAKIQFLKDLEAGKQTLKTLKGSLILRFDRFQHDPDTCYDTEGRPYTFNEVEQLVASNRKIYDICWAEVRTYANHEAMKASHNNQSQTL